MFVVKYRKFFVGLSLLLMVVSAALIGKFGLNFGIDFTGGSVLEVSYAEERPTMDVLRTTVAQAGFEDARVQLFGDDSVIVRTSELDDTKRAELMTALSMGDDEAVTMERFNTVGPTIGKELREKALIALIVVALAIIVFVAWAFRRVSKPVSSWNYGLAAVLALVHDVIIPIGIFALIGKEIDTLFVVGLLSILGLSVNDTIVVFDRVRENISNKSKDAIKHFDQVVGKSLKQTIARSINTSLTLIVVLGVLLVVGPVATRDLALVLLIGTIVGTYSSVFFASPLLLAFVSKKK
jgi:preprotein translocase SecF subunit